MHKSRIGALFIDHPQSSFQASLAFWAAATDRDVPAGAVSDDDPYKALGLFDGKQLIELQQVGDKTAPRVHLELIPPHGMETPPVG